MTLADELEALAAKATRVSLWSDCGCDGFSIGHEDGCQRRVIGHRLELAKDDAQRVAELLPATVAALRAMENNE